MPFAQCDLLTITSFSCDPEALKIRKGVVVSARVHPGESNASWMMQGLIDYLTGPSLDAKILRDNFVFKVRGWGRGWGMGRRREREGGGGRREREREKWIARMENRSPVRDRLY